MSTTNILDLNNRIDALEKNSGGGSTDSAKRSDIATEFSATTAYTAGCFVYYEGKLYQFNADHAAGAWDPTDVAEANVTDQVVSNASAIAGLTASDVAYDNTDSGLTATNVQGALDELRQADNVMLSDGVTSVEDALDGLTGSSLDNYVDLSDYTTNAYVCPSDGFVNIVARTTQQLGSVVNINGVINIGATMSTNANAYTSTYVKKGMTLLVTLKQTDDFVRFYPLT